MPMMTQTDQSRMSKPNYKRAERVADQLRIEVADILAKKSKDPRLQFVTVTNVEVTKDLRIARVYVSILGSQDEEPNVLKALNSASGFVRSEIGRRLELRYTPEIKFWIDSSWPRAERILKILDTLPPSDTGDVLGPSADHGAQDPEAQ